jgi:uncharacterized membrane protein YphA (DoxX/SURF4 family)
MNTAIVRRAGRVLLWIAQALLAAAMIGPGVQKFTSPVWRRMFEVWGYPDGFYLVIGVIEVVAGALLLVPRLASAAALVLMAVMIGAAVTQISHGRSGVGELVFLCVLAIIAYARWPGVLGQARALSARRSHA